MPFLARHLFFIVFLCVRVVCARGAFRGRNKYDVFHQGTKSRWCTVQEGGALAAAAAADELQEEEATKKKKKEMRKKGVTFGGKALLFFPS